MGRKTKTPILSADSIKEMWKAEDEGKPITAPAAIVAQAQEAISLKQQVEELKESAAKPKAITGQLRAALSDILAKHKISAAFEPLVELALERYPMDHKIEALRGQFVCDVDQRIRIWIELLQYQMPKLRAIEVSGEVDNTLTVLIRKFDDSGSIRQVTTAVEKSAAIEVPSTVVTPNDGGPAIKIRKF